MYLLKGDIYTCFGEYEIALEIEMGEPYRETYNRLHVRNQLLSRPCTPGRSLDQLDHPGRCRKQREDDDAG